MPVYKSILVNSQTSVKIWKIDESYEDLRNNLSLTPLSEKRVEGMKSEIHARGFLSVRHLLKEFGYSDEDLYYDKEGKPHLKDGKQISITHSFQFSGVIIGDKPNGIDIEMQREKINFIARKFIDYEDQWLQMYNENRVKQLCLIWCVKESLYKLYAKPGLSFKDHCMVIPFSIKDESTSCWIIHKDQKTNYNAQLLDFEGFNCAYITE